MAGRLKYFFSLFIGVRKLFITVLALLIVLGIFFVSLALLIKATINGGNFVEIVKYLTGVITAVVVGYYGTNMGKHLIDFGKEAVAEWIKKHKKS